MMASGIVDPTKVTRSALQDAASIASVILTTESVVADKKEEAPAIQNQAASTSLGDNDALAALKAMMENSSRESNHREPLAVG